MSLKQRVALVGPSGSLAVRCMSKDGHGFKRQGGKSGPSGPKIRHHDKNSSNPSPMAMQSAA